MPRWKRWPPQRARARSATERSSCNRSSARCGSARANSTTTRCEVADMSALSDSARARPTDDANGSSFPRGRESVDVASYTTHLEGNHDVMHSKMDPRLRGDDGPGDARQTRWPNAMSSLEREHVIDTFRKP